MKKLSNRIVWSPDCGGCMMEQKMVNGAWVDFNSFCEGEFPVWTKETAKHVKWHNLALRRNALKLRAEIKHEEYLKALSKMYAVESKQKLLFKK